MIKMMFNFVMLDLWMYKRLMVVIDKKYGSRATRTMAYVSRVDSE